MTALKAVILDDELGITALCDRVLRNEGYETHAFTDPIKALAYLERNQSDILLIDIRMPVMSGFDVIVEVHRQQPDIAVLVMTGYGTVETAIQALREGVDGLLLKPFEKKELLQAINQALSDKQKKNDSARIHVLRRLFDVTESFMSETRSERLVQSMVEAAGNLLQCLHLGYYQAKRQGESLERMAFIGRTPEIEEPTTGYDVIQKVDHSQSPILLNPGSGADSSLEGITGSTGYGAILCVPVQRNNLRGVLFAARDSESAPFRDSDLEMSQIFLRQAAVAMENAYLYSDLRDYIKRIEDSQAALVQAEKLATAGRMTASIAHEINNPLQAVQNCLHLAARTDLPVDVRQKYYEMTQLELERLMTTVQRMLEFYRPNISREKVDLIDLLDIVLNLLSNQLRNRGIRVTTAWGDKSCEIHAVSSQIQQVFINLILNAHDAMLDGGELIISIQQDYDKVRITFQDTGPGVPDDLKATIFEPFISTKTEGVGLGLSVSYGIVIAHGGNLELVDNEGPGACFRVTLPIGDS